YTTGVLSNETSALVHMVDTPELFGGELRILAAVDFADGKIVRWVDYRDASSFDGDLYAQFRTPADVFPADLRDSQVLTQAAPELDADGLITKIPSVYDSRQLEADRRSALVTAFIAP